ncbi:MAG: hypothetical protein NTV80_12330, partial [Verrucomicrobia bacterium]|nr:hypothetical protein [Verrucomicrobiota bacterium]
YEAIALFQEDGKEFRKIERRPDRRWLGHPETAAFADDGTFAVLSNSGDPDFSELSITFYNAEGLPTDMFVIPFSPFAVLGGFNGRLLSIGSKDCVTVYDRAGKQIGRVTKTPQWGTHFLTGGGRELCVVDVHSHKTDRYALP